MSQRLRKQAPALEVTPDRVDAAPAAALTLTQRFRVENGTKMVP